MADLRAALGVRDGDVVAFVGAGGKTTALLRLARELRAAGARPVVTTTTKIFVPAASDDLRLAVDRDRSRALGLAAEAIGSGAIPVVARATTPDGKLEGIPDEWVAPLAALAGVTHVLVEADGAAQLPLTAPREGEPVIPASATLVVAVVGADALGARVSGMHRPERIAALTGLAPSDALDARAIARVVLDPRGNVRGTPATARIVALVNKADDAGRLAAAREIAAALARAGARRVVIAALQAEEAVVEVAGQTGDTKS